MEGCQFTRYNLLSNLTKVLCRSTIHSCLCASCLSLAQLQSYRPPGCCSIPIKVQVSTRATRWWELFMNVHIASGDVTAALGTAPTGESLLVDAPPWLAGKNSQDFKLFLKKVDSKEESYCKSMTFSESQTPPTFQVCLVKAAFGFRKHMYYSHLPCFVQYQVACW